MHCTRVRINISNNSPNSHYYVQIFLKHQTFLTYLYINNKRHAAVCVYLYMNLKLQHANFCGYLIYQYAIFVYQWHIMYNYYYMYDLMTRKILFSIISYIILRKISILLLSNVCERHIDCIRYYCLCHWHIMLFENKLHSPSKWFFIHYCCANVYLVQCDGPAAVLNIFLTLTNKWHNRINSSIRLPRCTYIRIIVVQLRKDCKRNNVFWKYEKRRMKHINEAN